MTESDIFPGLLVTIGPNGAAWCDDIQLEGFTFRLETIGPDWMILRFENCRAVGATFVPGTSRVEMINILRS